MTIVINWIEQDKQIERCAEVACLNERLIIHYVDDLITKTEWSQQKVADTVMPLDITNKWSNLQYYLTHPIKTITLNLKQQGTAYRHKVWAEICKIPVGQTQTYSDLASKLDSGARAVANACRNNPFPGIIPCHRVVAVSGLGGYMGQSSGEFIDLKQHLLSYEATLLNNETWLKE